MIFYLEKSKQLCWGGTEQHWQGLVTRARCRNWAKGNRLHIRSRGFVAKCGSKKDLMHTSKKELKHLFFGICSTGSAGRAIERNLCVLSCRGEKKSV